MSSVLVQLDDRRWLAAVKTTPTIWSNTIGDDRAMRSVLERQLRRSQLFAAVQLAALATVPVVEPPDGPALSQIVFTTALLLTLTAVALLLTPTANKAAEQSTNPPPRLAERYVSAGRVALSLATACTVFLLLCYAGAALFGPGSA